MKNSNYLVLVYLVNFLLLGTFFYLGAPLWSYLLLVPAISYLQIYAAQQFSFRDSIALEQIPPRGYEKRLAEMQANEPLLQNLGFTRFDEFYLRASTDIIVYVYRHAELPIVFCQYHNEAYVSFDLDTKFTNGHTLTTANAKFSSLGEMRPPHMMLQAFAEYPLEMLFNKHLESLRYLARQGFVAREAADHHFRDEFLEEFRDAGKRHKGLLAPAKVVYHMYFGNQARFSKSIEEQALAKQLPLP